jgi:tetraacyldisaccharide 4'-kinase
MSLESYILDIIENRRPSFWIKRLLYGCSLGYRFIMALRNFLYEYNILKTHSVSVPVISVGNITVGGTGKTPLIREIVEQICQTKGEVAILTRGYRSRVEKKGCSHLISAGNGPLVGPEECGDEAYWLASCTKAAIWVGRDRVQSAKKAAKQSKILLMEDGLQHRRLKRDMDLVLLDGQDLFGKNFFLPRGLLRDSPSRLKDADYIIINHVTDNRSFQEAEANIRIYSHAPVIGMRPYYQLDAKWRGKKAGLFCGIAKPYRFYEAVKELGCEVVDHLFSPDHILPPLGDLQNFAEKCKSKGAEYLICTEKDLVKLSDPDLLDLEVVPLKMQLQCIYHQNFWQEMLENIKTRM